MQQESLPKKANSQQDDGWQSFSSLEEMVLERTKNLGFPSVALQLTRMVGTNTERRQNLTQLLIRLHNEGKIDVVRELKLFGETWAKPELDFWLLVRALKDVFHGLESPLGDICSLFADFDSIGKGDQANGMWWEYLTPRFQRDVVACHEMIRLAESHDEYCPGLKWAFVAGLSVDAKQWIAQAVTFLGKPSTHTKQFFNSILLAISDQVSVIHRKFLGSLWNALKAELEKDNPCFDWSVAYSLCHNARNRKAITKQQDWILHRIMENNDFNLLRQIAISVTLDYSNMDSKERGEAFIALSRIDPSDDTGKCLVHDLDVALSALIHDGALEQATVFLTSYIARWKVSFNVFSSTIEAFHRLPQQSGRIMTAWFLSGDRNLEMAATELAPDEVNDPPSPGIDIDQLKSGQDMFLSLMAKFIGYLFYKPKTMMRFVLPCLDLLDDDRVKKVSAILYDPVVLSYGDMIYKLIASPDCHLKKSSKMFLKSLLAHSKESNEQFVKAMPCPELTPTLEQRNALAAIRADAEQASYRRALESSIISKLTTPIALLHGLGMIQYVNHGNGKLERIEGRLERHTVSITFPALPDAIGREFRWRLALLKMGEWNIDPALELVK